MQLANIDGTYKTLLMAGSNATQFYSQTAASIGEILANGDIKEAGKQTLINQQLSLLNNGLAVIGGVANVDLNGLITPPAATTPAAPTTGAGNVYDNIRGFTNLVGR